MTGWQLCKMVVSGLIRLIGVTGEGSGCFLTSSLKTVDSPTGVGRGKNEPQDCSVRNYMAALIFPWKTRWANMRELSAGGLMRMLYALLDCVAFNKQSINITLTPKIQTTFKTLIFLQDLDRMWGFWSRRADNTMAASKQYIPKQRQSWNQTSQFTQFHHETHSFGPLLTVSQSTPNFSLSTYNSSLLVLTSHCNWFLYKFTRVNISTIALN